MNEKHLPYSLTKTDSGNNFKFSKNNITITGHLSNKENTSCIVIYETKTEFYGINLFDSHFKKFSSNAIEKVLNGIPVKEFPNKVFVNFENFFAYFSKEDFKCIVEGLSLFTNLYNSKL